MVMVRLMQDTNEYSPKAATRGKREINGRFALNSINSKTRICTGFQDLNQA